MEIMIKWKEWLSRGGRKIRKTQRKIGDASVWPCFHGARALMFFVWLSEWSGDVGYLVQTWD